MANKTSWLPYFRNLMLAILATNAAINIYRDGFRAFTWLSSACLAGMFWVTTTNPGEKFDLKKAQPWVAMASLAGMLVDFFLIK